MRALQSSELFKPNWKALDIETAWKICHFLDSIAQQLSKGLYLGYGYTLKALLYTASLSKHRKVIKTLSDEQKVDVFNDKDLFFHQPFTHFYTKAIKASFNGMVICLEGPEEDMANTTYEHFSFIDAAYSSMLLAQYHKQDDIQQYINKFIATLYKPALKPFDKQMVEHWESQIKLPDYHIVMIIKAYTNIRVNIINRCPYLLPFIADESKKKEIVPTYTGDMWRSLHFDMAETSAFQGFENAANANIYDALDYLEKKAKDSYTKNNKE